MKKAAYLGCGWLLLACLPVGVLAQSGGDDPTTARQKKDAPAPRSVTWSDWIKQQLPQEPKAEQSLPSQPPPVQGLDEAKTLQKSDSAEAVTAELPGALESGSAKADAQSALQNPKTLGNPRTVQRKSKYAEPSRRERKATASPDPALSQLPVRASPEFNEAAVLRDAELLKVLHEIKRAVTGSAAHAPAAAVPQAQAGAVTWPGAVVMAILLMNLVGTLALCYWKWRRRDASLAVLPIEGAADLAVADDRRGPALRAVEATVRFAGQAPEAQAVQEPVVAELLDLGRYDALVRNATRLQTQWFQDAPVRSA